MHEQFERVAALLVEDPPRPTPTIEQLGARVRRRRRRRVVATTVPGLLVLAVGLVVVTDLREAGEGTIVPATPPESVVPIPSTSAATGTDVDGWGFADTTEAESELSSTLGLTAGWSIVRAVSETTESDPPMTIQRWGAASGDPLVYDRMIEVVMVPADGEPIGSDIEFVDAFGPSLQAMWVAGDTYFVAHADGLTTTEAEAYLDQLVPRRPGEPMAGFEPPPSSELLPVEESVSDRGSSQIVTTLSIGLRDRNGMRAQVTIADRAGLSLLVGVANRRIRLGDQIGVLSPPDYPDTRIDWTTDSIQYSVTSTNDAAQGLATLIAAQPTATWHTYLEAARVEPVDLLAVTVAITAAAGIDQSHIEQIAAQLHERGVHVLEPAEPASLPTDETAIYQRAEATLDDATELMRILGITDPDRIHLGLRAELEDTDVDLVVVIGNDHQRLVADAAAHPCAYTILQGDTPARIAEQFNISVDELQAANPELNLDTSTGDLGSFAVGNQLRIPDPACEPD
jgi:LysM repeat protein